MLCCDLSVLGLQLEMTEGLGEYVPGTVTHLVLMAGNELVVKTLTEDEDVGVLV